MPSLAQHFEKLDKFEERIPLDYLNEWIQETEMHRDELERYVRFHPDRYQRNSMATGSAYQALVLCWRNGQRSPIHDHEGSSCVLRVVQGVATETIFDFAANGMIYARSSRELAEGYYAASQDRDIHQVSNLQANDADLVTLHVYSPPLLTMNVYSLSDEAVTRFDDPINYDFMAGAGI